MDNRPNSAQIPDLALSLQLAHLHCRHRTECIISKEYRKVNEFTCARAKEKRGQAFIHSSLPEHVFVAFAVVVGSVVVCSVVVEFVVVGSVGTAQVERFCSYYWRTSCRRLCHSPGFWDAEQTQNFAQMLILLTCTAVTFRNVLCADR